VARWKERISGWLGLGLFFGLLFIIVLLGVLDAVVAHASGGIGSALSTLAVSLVFAGCAIYAVVRRGLEFQALAREGVDADGWVVSKRSFARGRAGALKYQVTYGYRDGAGRVHRRAGFVSEELWRQLAPGGVVELVYLPRKPTVSALRAEVLVARQALRRSANGADGQDGCEG